MLITNSASYVKKNQNQKQNLQKTNSFQGQNTSVGKQNTITANKNLNLRNDVFKRTNQLSFKESGYYEEKRNSGGSSFAKGAACLALAASAVAIGIAAFKKPAEAKNAGEELTKTIKDDVGKAVTEKLGNIKEEISKPLEEKLAKSGADLKNEISGLQENIGKISTASAAKEMEVVPICSKPIGPRGIPLKLSFPKFDDVKPVSYQVMDSIKKSISPAGRKAALEAIAKKPKIINPRIANISYEGLAGVAGGQASVARELPDGLQKAKADVFDIAPFIEGKMNGKELKIIKDETRPDGYILENQVYTTGIGRDGKPFDKRMKATKVYEQKVSMVIGGKEVEKTMEVYHGPHTTDQSNPRDVFFIRDKEESFYAGSYTDKANIYNDHGVGSKMDHRKRMALFNRYTFELLDAMKEGKIKLKMPDNTEKVFKPVDRIIAHETWQSGGLYMQMRTKPVIEAHLDNNLKPRADYYQELADTSLTDIHNVAPDYQGRIWNCKPGDEKPMEDILGILYGKRAKQIVEEGSFIDFVHKDTGKPNIETATARAGFVAEKYNPVTMALAGGGKMVSVSKGYHADITENLIAGEVTPLVKAFDEIGALRAVRNGIDRNKQLLVPATAEKINKFLKMELYPGAKPVEGIPEVLPLHKADGTPVDNVIEAKKTLKTAWLMHLKAVVPMLKDDAQYAKLKQAHPENWGKASLLKGTEQYTDLSTITPDTPLVAISGRYDKQKGFDTIIMAVEKLDKMAEKTKLSGSKEKIEQPVIVIAGSPGDDEYKKGIVALKNQLKEKGNRIVVLDGMMGGETYSLLQSSADFGLMPSRFEPCGIGDAEMMNRFTPIIGANVGGIPEKVKDAGIIMKGFIGKVDPDAADMNHNANQLANALIEGITMMKEDPQKYHEMVLKAGKEDFSWYKEVADASGKKVMDPNCPIAKYLEEMHAEIRPEGSLPPAPAAPPTPPPAPAAPPTPPPAPAAPPTPPPAPAAQTLTQGVNQAPAQQSVQANPVIQQAPPAPAQPTVVNTPAQQTPPAPLVQTAVENSAPQPPAKKKPRVIRGKGTTAPQNPKQA